MRVSGVFLWCCIYVLVAAEDDGQEKKNVEKRDVQPFGDQQPNQEVHDNVKAVIVTKKVPVPYPVQVEKKVPYPVKYTVRRPFTVFVPKPYLVEIPKPVPYTLKVPVPQPFTVEKHVPVPYRVAVDKPVPVHVPKPFPVYLEKKVPYTVDKHVPYHVQVPVERPYAVPVPVEKHFPITVEKPVPYPISVPIERPVPVPVEKPYPVHINNPVPYQVEKYMSYPWSSGGQQGSSVFNYNIQPPTSSPSFSPSPQDPSLNSGYQSLEKPISFLPDSNPGYSSYLPQPSQQSTYLTGSSPQSSALIGNPGQSSYFPDNQGTSSYTSENEGQLNNNPAQSSYQQSQPQSEHLTSNTEQSSYQVVNQGQTNYFPSSQGQSSGESSGLSSYLPENHVEHTNYFPDRSIQSSQSLDFGQSTYFPENHTVPTSNGQAHYLSSQAQSNNTPVSSNYFPEINARPSVGHHTGHQTFAQQLHFGPPNVHMQRGYYPRLFEPQMNVMKFHNNFKGGPPTSLIHFQQQSMQRPNYQFQPFHHHSAPRHYPDPLQAAHTHISESFLQQSTPVKSSVVPLQQILGIRPSYKQRPFRLNQQRVVSNFNVHQINEAKKNNIVQPTVAAIVPTTYSPASYLNKGNFQAFTITSAPQAVSQGHTSQHIQSFHVHTTQPTIAPFVQRDNFGTRQQQISVEKGSQQQVAESQSYDHSHVSPTKPTFYEPNFSSAPLLPTPVMLIQMPPDEFIAKGTTYIPEGNYSIQTTSVYTTQPRGSGNPQVLALVASPQTEPSSYPTPTHMTTFESLKGQTDQEVRQTTAFFPKETSSSDYQTDTPTVSETVSLRTPYSPTQEPLDDTIIISHSSQDDDSNNPLKRKGPKSKGRLTFYTKGHDGEQDYRPTYVNAGVKGGKTKGKKRPNRPHRVYEEEIQMVEPQTTAAVESQQTPEQTTPLVESPIVVPDLEDSPTSSLGLPSPTVETTAEDVSHVHVAQYESGDIQVLQSKAQVFHPTPSTEEGEDKNPAPATSFTEMKRSFGKRTRRLTKNNSYVKRSPNNNNSKES